MEASGAVIAFETPIGLSSARLRWMTNWRASSTCAALRYVDASRIGTDGKSFGGYMTLYTP